LTEGKQEFDEEHTYIHYPIPPIIEKIQAHTNKYMPCLFKIK